jgi:hypothetical protein
MTTVTDSDPDVIWGAAAIAATINKTPRAVFHLLENGHLPARKIGGQWVASRKKLLATITGDGSSA